MKSIALRRFAWLPVVLSGCVPFWLFTQDDDGDDTDAVDACRVDVTGQVQVWPVDRWIDAEVTLKGTATSALAIRRLVVGGVAARADTVNFGTWSATLPIDTLRAFGEERVRLTLEAEDWCHTVHTLDEVEVWVLPAGATIPVRDLRVVGPSYSGPVAAIPVNKSAFAEVTFCAAPLSVGAVLDVVAAGGALVGATDGKVTLRRGTSEACGGEAAVASVSVLAAGASDVTVRGSAVGARAEATVVVVPEPSFVPDTVTVRGGGATSLAVDAPAPLAQCTLTAPDPSTIAGWTVNDQSVSGVVWQAPAPRTTLGGAADVAVETSAGVADVPLALRCVDVFGQPASTTVTVQAAPERVPAEGLTATWATEPPCRIAADGSQVAELRLCAASSAVGVSVQPTVTGGTAVPPSGSAVVLAGGPGAGCDIGAGAHATVFATPDAAATRLRAWVSTAGQPGPAAELVVVPAPVLSAPTTAIAPGTTRRVLVDTAGHLARCTWRALDDGVGFTVSVDGAEIAGPEVRFEPLDDGACATLALGETVGIDVSAAADAADGRLRVSCVDDLGQARDVDVEVAAPAADAPGGASL